MHIYVAVVPFQISWLPLTSNAQWDTHSHAAKFTQFAHRKYFYTSLWSKCVNCMTSTCYYDNGKLPVWLLLNFCVTATGRRSAPPLNLTGLPGTEKLNEREKEVQLSLLCAYRFFIESLRPHYASNEESHLIWCVVRLRQKAKVFIPRPGGHNWTRAKNSGPDLLVQIHASLSQTDAQGWSHRLCAILLQISLHPICI